MPYSYKQIGNVSGYVRNPHAVARHPFLPLMHVKKISYPFKKNCSGKRKCKRKVRDICYVSHIDAAIYGYYSTILQDKYETLIKKNGLDDVVTAYRKVKENSHRNKSSIDFANDVFSYLSRNVGEKCPLSVITFDIKGFFDNLSHQILKEKWKKTLNVEELSVDWYQIFKHVTKYSWVEEKDVFDLFKSRIKCRTRKGKISEKKILRKHYLRDKNAIAFCDKSDLRLIRAKGLIKSRPKTENYGIPQGLPISATLANVYMQDFDLEAMRLLSMVGGIYRRYSDDIIVVCPLCVGKYVRRRINEMIESVKLTIESNKTNYYTFTVVDGKVLCCHEKFGHSKTLEYLGFSFDGNRILLKNSSVSKFYNKMHKSICRALYFSVHINNKTKGKLFEHKLIKHYTGAGSRTHRKYKRVRCGKFVLSTQRSYGNFLTYAYKSAKIMHSQFISHQVSRCSNKLNKKIQEAKKKIRAGLFAQALQQIDKYGRTF